MAAIPEWIRQAQAKWRYRGQDRPPFAEQPTEGQESVWDYPRPPRIAPDDRLVLVKHGDLLVAESRRAVRVLETASPPTIYIPREDIRVSLEAESPGGSFCEWKGAAQWWVIELPSGESIRRAAWSNESTLPGFEQIAGHVSFYPSLLACYLGGVRAMPQPGRFYAGWVTPELAGPFKGEPGTESW